MTLKQRIILWIYKKISKIPVFPTYSLEEFQRCSQPIIKELLQIDGITIGAPDRLIDGGLEYHFKQYARIKLDDKTHISISWTLQDDGRAPYPVIDVFKFIQIHQDPRAGILEIGITSIYPFQIPNIKQLIKKVIDQPI